MKRALPIALGALLVAGCQAADDFDDVTNVRSGRCNLMKNLTPALCLEFADGYNTNNASTLCGQEKARYQASIGVNGHSYVSGESQDCETSSTVGRCTMTYGFIRYYSSEFNAGSAQTDCTGVQMGAWAP